LKWRDIPEGAKHYIIYHTIINPLLIVWYMLPMYMFITGYNILEIGFLFSLVHILSIPLTYIIGKFFDKLPIRNGLILIDAMDGISSLMYGLAYGPLAPIFLLSGLLIDDLTRLFYPLYQAAEKLLYPKEKIEEIFNWHMRLPELSQILTFPVFGYLLGYVFNQPLHYRIGFILISISTAFTIYYLVKFLPPLDIGERIEPEGFVFRVDSEFRLILLLEALTTFAWTLAPAMVMINYVINVLGLSFFEAMLVEVSVSLGAILATYVSDLFVDYNRFKIIGFGYMLISLWALIMFLNPPFPVVAVAYFISRFGNTLVFPYYRGWVFEKIPKDKSSSLFAAISSYNKVFALFSPAIAGFLASVYATLPYIVSLCLFIVSSVIMVIYSYKG